MFNSVPKSILILIITFCMLLFCLILTPDLLEKIIMPILYLPISTILFFCLVIPNSIAAGGGPYLFLIITGCFLPALLLRWRIPEQVKIITKYWPLICFMMGCSLFYPGESRWYISLYLFLMPALAGLAFGKMVKHWR